MKRQTRLGSRIAEVHNGSSLLTGDAGQGESNIRRWIIENDWLEAIVALPLNLFYNTGDAPPVIKRIHKRGSEPDPLRGLFETTISGKPALRSSSCANTEPA